MSKRRTTAPAPRPDASVQAPAVEEQNLPLPEAPDIEGDADMEDNSIPDEIPGDEDADQPADEPAPEATPEPAKAPPAPPSAPEASVVQTEENVEVFLKAKYRNIQSIPGPVQQIIQRLEDYSVAMGPNVPMTQEKGSQHQRALYQTFMIALGLTGGQHRMAIDAINWYFNKHRRGAFSARMVCRYTDASRLTKSESSSFGLLANLFVATCNPATRKANLAAVNMRHITDKLPNSTCQQNLLDYYTR